MVESTKSRREEGWEGRWRKIFVRQCNLDFRVDLPPHSVWQVASFTKVAEEPIPSEAIKWDSLSCR